MRSLGNEARSKMSAGGTVRETVEECHLLQFLSPSLHAYFPSCRVYVHLNQSLPFLPLLPYSPQRPDKPLSHQGTWLGLYFIHNHRRPYSPSGEAVKLSIITKLREMMEGRECKASEWNLGRTFGGRRAAFETDNRCFSPGLISAATGKLIRSPVGQQFKQQ